MVGGNASRSIIARATYAPSARWTSQTMMWPLIPQHPLLQKSWQVVLVAQISHIDAMTAKHGVGCAIFSVMTLCAW